ncbi:MAG: mechanosensitive ion channel [Deltaproteobacteria bacterium]|nr:mechanosensitive ion channel [Deltaproteobacteria bacterium]
MPDSLFNLPKIFIYPVKVLYSYLVWSVYALIVVSLLGLNISGLFALLGGLGLGFGLSIKSLISNFISGLVFFLNRIFDVGDRIQIESTHGTITKRNILSIEIRTLEKAVLKIPNSKLMSCIFINWIKNSRNVRRKIMIKTDCNVDTPKILNLLIQSVEEANKFENLNVTDYDATFDKFEENYLLFSLYITINNIDDEFKCLSILRSHIKSIFKEAKINLYTPSIKISVDNYDSSHILLMTK